MKWIRSLGSAWERAYLRWRGAAGPTPERIDIFAALRSARRILVAPNDRVGGLFLAAPAYRMVRQSYPGGTIALLVEERHAGLAHRIPFVDEVQVAPLDVPVWRPAFRAAQARLAQQQYDLALCLGPDCSFRLAYLCQTCGARLRIGFHRPDLEPFNVEIINADPTRFEAEQHAQLLRLVGLRGEGEVRWVLSEDRARQIRARFLGRGAELQRAVGLDLGASEGGGLGRRLCDEIVGRLVERGVRTLLFFPLSERKLAARLKQAYAHHVVPVAQDDLGTVAALLQGCEVLIAANTDLLHLGISLEVPAVGLFDRDPRRWVAPDSSSVRVVHCSDLRTLPVSHVVTPVEQVLSSK
ncbi:MAG: glycosyltransferase family 9 protein [Candidatus Latescibacterota bacterium]